MSKLVNPLSELIRAPEVMVPNTKPQCPVQIVQGSPLKDGFLFSNSLRTIRGKLLSSSLSAEGSYSSSGGVESSGSGLAITLDARASEYLLPNASAGEDGNDFVYVARCRILETTPNLTNVVLFTNGKLFTATNAVSLYAKSNGTSYAVKAYVDQVALGFSNFNISVNQWFTTAVSRHGTTVSVWGDGVLIKTDTNSPADPIWNKYASWFATLGSESDGGLPGNIEFDSFLYLDEYYDPAEITRDPYQFLIPA